MQALASMHADEKEPYCVMSRAKGQRKTTTGARSMRPHTSGMQIAEPKAKRRKGKTEQEQMA